MNLAGVYHGLTSIFRPSRLLPTLVVDEFSDIPSNLSEALATQYSRRLQTGSKQTPDVANIRALVVDKDNCFAVPHELNVAPKYQNRWDQLRKEFPGDRILIVSNSSGTKDDRDHAEAKLLETRLNTKVLIHDTKKPGCHDQVMDYLIKLDAKVDHPNQVVVIGDRLFTDVLMANNMGAHSIWVRHGTVQDSGLLSRMEKLLYQHVLS